MSQPQTQRPRRASTPSDTCQNKRRLVWKCRDCRRICRGAGEVRRPMSNSLRRTNECLPFQRANRPWRSRVRSTCFACLLQTVVRAIRFHKHWRKERPKRRETTFLKSFLTPPVVKSGVSLVAKRTSLKRVSQRFCDNAKRASRVADLAGRKGCQRPEEFFGLLQSAVLATAGRTFEGAGSKTLLTAKRLVWPERATV